MMNSNGISLFLFGLCAGVAGAVLFAPKSGMETRRDIQKKAQAGVDYVKGQAQEAANTASAMIDRGAQTVRAQREHLKAAVEAGRSAYREAVTANPVAAGNA